MTGPYYYAAGDLLPHRRPVRWLSATVDRADMSEGLRNSAGTPGTVSDLTRAGHHDEITRLLGGGAAQTPAIMTAEGTVENPSAFAMEKHLEDFLVQNWRHTEFGRDFVIFEEDGEPAGQQYLTDTGPLDILAVSKDRKSLLVIELKKGRPSDAVVGQCLRYMGFVKDELAEEGQSVIGAIIALEDDQRIRRALAMVPKITFYRYQISFKLVKS